MHSLIHDRPHLSNPVRIGDTMRGSTFGDLQGIHLAVVLDRRSALDTVPTQEALTFKP